MTQWISTGHQDECRSRQTSAAGTLACGLALAAAPVFALMALVSAVSPDTGAAGMLCSSASGWGSWSGMTFMYLLMSLFHCAPWLKRFADRPPPSKHLSTGG
jgi:hypothetical protein